MNLPALIRKALADVTRRLGRSILVILGILIGVFGLTTINLTTDAIQSAFAYSNNRTAFPNISFLVDKVDPSLATNLQSIPKVQTVQIDTSYVTRWHTTSGSGHVNLTITGYQDFSNIKFNPFQLVSGRLPGAGEILMESNDRALQSFGDTITVDSPTGPQQLRVVGTTRTQGQAPAITGMAIAYMSATSLEQISGLAGPNDVEVKAVDKNKVNDTAKAVFDALRTNNVMVLSITIVPETSISSLTGLFDIVRVLSIIALLLTSFLIFNTISTLVAEQIKIIGTMKAMGGSRSRIIGSYLFSVSIYSIVGIILGIVLGLLAGYWLTGLILNTVNADLGPYSLSPGIIITSILVGLLVPFAAAMLPLWTGTRITVRDALAAYGTTTANTRQSEHKLASRLTWISQSTWLGIRGIFRKPGRAILTLLALALSGTAFLAIQTTTYSFNQALNQAFDVDNFDALVALASPQDYTKVQKLIQKVPNVGSIERAALQSVKTDQGQLVLQGVEANTRQYHYQLVNGRWFNGDEPNALVLSDVAAGRLHLSVGDKLTLSGPTAIKVTWTIVGEVHDISGGSAGSLGIALTTMENLNAFDGTPANLVQALFVQASDRSQKAIDQMANALDTTLSNAGLSPTITTAKQVKDENLAAFQIIYLILYAVAALVALVGILGLFNTLTTSILERRREIGILRSMGASSWRVGSVFWVEGLSLAIFAWLVAIILGIPGAYGFIALIDAEIFPVPFAFDPTALLIMLIFIIVIATLASFGPILRASRTRIVETLRYE